MAGILVMASGLGLPEAGAREVSVRPERAQVLADQVLGGRLVALSVLGAMGLVLVAALAPAEIPLLLLSMALALGTISAVDWLLRGLGRMKVVAAALAAGGTAVLGASLAATAIDLTAEKALALFVAAEFLIAAVTLRGAPLYRMPRPNLRTLRTAVRHSWPLGASALILYSYFTNLDTILLSILRSASEAGLYSAPYRLFLTFLAIGSFAAYAVLGPIARAADDGPARLQQAMRSLRASTVPLAGFGLVVLGVAELSGATILRFLFGERFSAMDDVFLILAIAVPWYSVSFPVGYALIARGANRLFLVGAGVAGALNIGLNLVLIPSLGPEGAAIATTAAIVGGGLAWLGAQRFLDSQYVRVLGPIAAASLGAVAALILDGASVVLGVITVSAGALAIASALREVPRLARN